MRVSLINISPTSVVWRTIRNQSIIRGTVPTRLAVRGDGTLVDPSTVRHIRFAGHAEPFADLSTFFNCLPKLEYLFHQLSLKEFTHKFVGIPLLNPTIAFQLTDYGRPLHLGEKSFLKDSVLRWGARTVISCDRAEPLTDDEFLVIQAI